MKQKAENKTREKMEVQEETNTELIIGEYCFPGNFISDRVGEGNLVVRKDCLIFTCNELFFKPSFSSQTFPNGTYNANPCSTDQSGTNNLVSGIYSILWSNTKQTSLQYFNRENFYACFDNLINKWRFGVKPTIIITHTFW